MPLATLNQSEQDSLDRVTELLAQEAEAAIRARSSLAPLLGDLTDILGDLSDGQGCRAAEGTA